MNRAPIAKLAPISCCSIHVHTLKTTVSSAVSAITNGGTEMVRNPFYCPGCKESGDTERVDIDERDGEKVDTYVCDCGTQYTVTFESVDREVTYYGGNTTVEVKDE